MARSGSFRIVAGLGPGLLLAATGVGAGDLATASFTGAQLGTTVLWAVAVGAFLKFVINEGLARWQLATGTTFLEGVQEKLGFVTAVIFLPYLFVWSFFVGLALISACGVAMHAAIPVFDDAADGKIVFGVGHSLLGAALVLLGGFRLFEKIMSICIGCMFATVVITAGLLWPGAPDVLRGFFVPDIAGLLDNNEHLTWTVALIGGVGGTLTVLCYGYWIREKGLDDTSDLGTCRLDLGLGYAVTGLFGASMIIIGSTVQVEGSGATLIVDLANRLEEPIGAAGKWAFLLGAWGAVFSSLLGVWQAVPYLFADFWQNLHRQRGAMASSSVDTKGWPYRTYVLVLTFVPLVGLRFPFREVQKYYAVFGACLIPLLCLGLLVFNGRSKWVGRWRNRPATVIVLAVTLAVFLFLLYYELRKRGFLPEGL